MKARPGQFENEWLRHSREKGQGTNMTASAARSVRLLEILFILRTQSTWFLFSPLYQTPLTSLLSEVGINAGIRRRRQTEGLCRVSTTVNIQVSIGFGHPEMWVRWRLGLPWTPMLRTVETFIIIGQKWMRMLELRRQCRAHRMTGSDARFGTVYIILQLLITRVPFSYSPSPGSIRLSCSILTSQSPRAFARVPVPTRVNEGDTFISTEDTQGDGTSSL
jgi:hypothetical protein